MKTIITAIFLVICSCEGAINENEDTESFTYDSMDESTDSSEEDTGNLSCIKNNIIYENSVSVCEPIPYSYLPMHYRKCVEGQWIMNKCPIGNLCEEKNGEAICVYQTPAHN